MSRLLNELWHLSDIYCVLRKYIAMLFLKIRLSITYLRVIKIRVYMKKITTLCVIPGTILKRSPVFVVSQVGNPSELLLNYAFIFLMKTVFCPYQ